MAGVSAAVAAARTGVQVVLVEQEAFLGGAGVAALHRFICGLYLNGPDKPADTLNGGLVREIVARLQAIAPTNQPMQMGRVWVFPFETTDLRSVYENLACREANLTIVRSAEVEAVRSESNRILSIRLRTPDGLTTIAPRAVIDATGSGAVIRLSGAAFELARESERQLGGCTIHIGGIAGDRQLLGIKIPWCLSRLPRAEIEELPVFAGFAGGSSKDDGFCKWSVSPESANVDDALFSERIARLHSLLAADLPEFANSRILAYSRAMEREGIRLAGEWELDQDSVLHARKFPDGLVRNAWPIEFWDQRDAAPRYAYPPDGDYYEIPGQCLRSRTISNLIATGRCISASSQALASTRVMGTCMALGEAAGILAASRLE